MMLWSQKYWGLDWNDLTKGDMPACQAERARFMAEDEFTQYQNHPYKSWSPIHKHFKETRFRHPPFSAGCIPFRWMLKEKAIKIDESLDLKIDWPLEERIDEQLGKYSTDWVQAKQNQQILLNTFFSAIKPNDSLCLFYAKQTPLSDDFRRVLIGIGRVTNVGDLVEYDYEYNASHGGYIWERSIEHSIREGFFDGFLLPYHEILKLAENDSSVDPSDYVVFAPDDAWEQFSYAAEHVSHDIAISCLIQCERLLRKVGKVLPGDWEQCLQWVDSELNRIWKMRGPCPGLGAVLKAAGFHNGNLIAHDIAMAQLESGNEWNEDPWFLVEEVLADPSLLGNKYEIDKTICEKLLGISPERKAFIRLLSRFKLNDDQSRRYYDDRRRKESGINASDNAFLENPYLFYELDRNQVEPISVWAIDRGLFPDPIVREKHPVPSPSNPTGPSDLRRLRALMVHRLEIAAAAGHTLQSVDQLLSEIEAMELKPACPVDTDLMALIDGTLEETINKVEMADKTPAYQLNWLHEMGTVIRRTVKNRMKGIPHDGDHNWGAMLDKEFGSPTSNNPEIENFEKKARLEKIAALRTIYASRISVLIGPAGTGKTTLLKLFCDLPEMADGVLFLAPTGKARVRIETQTGRKGAKTVAQFLRPLKRYNPVTGHYRLRENPKEKGIKTIVIDEASMLTEDQLAAVINAVETPERLILVGDPQQLPPIGAGRPFYDVIKELTPENVESIFPKFGKGYAELTMNHRQRETGREDMLLADWFSGRPLDAGSDEIWNGLTRGYRSRYLKLEIWQTEEDLRDRLLECIVDELKLDGPDDEWNFELSIGGNVYKDKIYFNYQRSDWHGAAEVAEGWQVLTPVRGSLHGVEALNRFIQGTFRKNRKALSLSEDYWKRVIPKPVGREGIIYGDKVINENNQQRYAVYPKETALKYVANGEIGVVIGEYRGANSKNKSQPKRLEVEFSSQPGFKYTYGGMDFADDGKITLSLAYALTIHKTQGSEFGTTFLIVPELCPLISRELMYTALTRQRKRLVILYQSDFWNLRKYSETYFSETARRLTNLFIPPKMLLINDKMLAEGLIHRTACGEAVRSKSEVVIADLLYSSGIKYNYEQELRGADGGRRYPDFTITSAETGKIYYWEHLGMLINEHYRRRWEQKLRWYREQEILPYEEGGGKRGTLLITQDSSEGGIDAQAIKAVIEEIFEA